MKLWVLCLHIFLSNKSSNDGKRFHQPKQLPVFTNTNSTNGPSFDTDISFLYILHLVILSWTNPVYQILSNYIKNKNCIQIRENPIPAWRQPLLQSAHSQLQAGTGAKLASFSWKTQRNMGGVPWICKEGIGRELTEEELPERSTPDLLAQLELTPDHMIHLVPRRIEKASIPL